MPASKRLNTIKYLLEQSLDTGMAILLLVIALPLLSIGLAVALFGAVFYIPMLVWERWRQA